MLKYFCRLLMQISFLKNFKSAFYMLFFQFFISILLTWLIQRYLHSFEEMLNLDRTMLKKSWFYIFIFGIFESLWISVFSTCIVGLPEKNGGRRFTAISVKSIFFYAFPKGYFVKTINYSCLLSFSKRFP